MKRIRVVLIFMLFMNMYKFPTNIALAKTETIRYAKALDYCVLYKTDNFNDDIDNIYFLVPETYFVVVLDTINDDCYKVQYDKYVGFVKSEAVTIATFVPIIKFLNEITCDLKEASGTQIWSNPSTNGNVLTTISAGTTNIKYVSMCYGKIPSGGESNLWYYVSYTPEFNLTNVYEGYIYSENVSRISKISPNIESNPEIIGEGFSSDNVIYISSSMKTILVVIIAVPIILFILILLYKISKKVRIFTNKVNFQKNNQNDVVENNSLKNEIENFKGVPFFRKLNTRQNEINYPHFPKYDSDDDWL